MSDDATKPILLVKKADAKNASLWNKLTNGRIIKQHGGFDIPEGDLHAIQKYQSPLEEKEASPEETKETLSEIEKEIQQLKEKNRPTQLPPRPVQSGKVQFFENPEQDFKKQENQDDDLY